MAQKHLCGLFPASVTEPLNRLGRGVSTQSPGACDCSSSESGEDSDEENHANEDEGDQDEHQPQQPVDGLLGVLLQSLRLGLQLLQVHVSLTHRLTQSLKESRVGG